MPNIPDFPEVDIFSIHLQHIEVIRSLVERSAGAEARDLRPITGYNFGIQQSSGFSLERKSMRQQLFIKVESQHAENGSEADIIGEFAFSFVFHIATLEQHHTEQHGRPTVDLKLASNLLRIAYSTARGMVWERTVSTPLGGVLTPVIDVVKVLQEGKSEMPPSRLPETEA